MPADNQSQRSIDAGDVPGNPLRSYRMAMLGHGFVDDPTGGDLKLDESDAIGYGLLRIRRESVSLTWVAIGVVAVLAIIAVLVAIT